jgi:predicted transcriptional regulator
VCRNGTGGGVHTLPKDDLPRDYTIILKLTQIMGKKGLVKRYEKQIAHTYCTAMSNAQVHRNLVKQILAGGSPVSTGKLVLQAPDVRRVSREELANIRSMLDGIIANILQ